FCLGESATIGGTGEAWMRRGTEPMQSHLGQPLEADTQRQHLSPGIPEHRRSAPLKLSAGDVLGYEYKPFEQLGSHRGPEGNDSAVLVAKSRLALFLNGHLAFQFEFDGRLPDKPLYAVVDVCYSVYQVSLVTEEKADLLTDEKADLLIGG
ncbi:unnamed protein product, partial [Polarella glacialis]